MAVLVEQRSFRPFKSSEEYLYAMKEDLAEWLNSLYPDLYININNFMDRLDTGVALCKHANNVRKYAEDYVSRRQAAGKTNVHSIATSVLYLQSVRFLPGAKAGTFFARDNVSNFITWCRHGLGVFECLLFETDDLIMRKNEKHVILCLLEVARRAAKLGMPAPMLVHLEREIDREIAAEKRRLKFGGNHDYYDDGTDEESDLTDSEDCVEFGPIPQIVTNDLKSLDEMVRDAVEKCQCPTQFPMIRVSEGKYRIGDTKVLIFVRVLRSHVMVRVGGGWDTLAHYLDKHDPCRCKAAHRSTVSSKLVGIKSGGPALELSHAQVHYERSPPRTRRSSTSSNSSGAGGTNNYGVISKASNRCKSPRNLSPGNSLDRRSRSPTPRRKAASASHRNQNTSLIRSRSPTPSLINSRSRSGTPSCRKQRISSSDRSDKDKNNLSVPNSNSICHKESSKLSRSRSPSIKSRSPSRTRYSCPNSPSSSKLGRKQMNKAASNHLELKQNHEDSETPTGPGGVDYSPTHKVSDNFKGACQYHTDIHEPPRNLQTETSGVDYSPTHKVSDNFKGTIQYGLLNSNPVNEINSRRSPSPFKEKSGVDTTPSSKVSDNFICTELSSPTVPIRKGVSVNDLDTITKKSDLNDSGSEVSDEGYRSLGIVPPSSVNNTNVQSATFVNGSTIVPVRPPRSRSVGGQETPSPQTSPFHRNSKTNKSARQSPTHHYQVLSKQPITHQSRNNSYNTWNSSVKKKRSPVSEDIFCQQVAEIMQQYAALMPSPRKDTRPDTRISTRIPAPVQQRT